MKYEMIFGDEALFDGAPEDAIFVIRDDNGCFIYGYAIKTRFDFMSESKSFGVAMRRIIKEPKRWTWEDKKAGRLPEVGCEVILRTSGELATVNAVHKNMVCLTFSDGGFSPFNVERIDPIETPAEKAQREEDEFVNSVSMFVDVCTSSDEIKKAHKAGIRAAYRKLKGVE